MVEKEIEHVKFYFTGQITKEKDQTNAILFIFFLQMFLKQQTLTFTDTSTSALSHTQS